MNFSEKMNIIMRNVFQHWYLIFNLVGNVFLNSLIISKAIWKYISIKVENQILVLKYISHYDIHFLSVYPQCSFFYVESKFFSKRYLKKFNHNEKIIFFYNLCFGVFFTNQGILYPSKETSSNWKTTVSCVHPHYYTI